MSDTFDHAGDAFYDEIQLAEDDPYSHWCFSDLVPDTEADIAYREELERKHRSSRLTTKEQLAAYFAGSFFKIQDLVMTPDKGPCEIVAVTMGLDYSYWYTVVLEGRNRDPKLFFLYKPESYKENCLKDYWGKDWRGHK